MTCVKLWRECWTRAWIFSISFRHSGCVCVCVLTLSSLVRHCFSLFFFSFSPSWIKIARARAHLSEISSCTVGWPCFTDAVMTTEMASRKKNDMENEKKKKKKHGKESHKRCAVRRARAAQHLHCGKSGNTEILARPTIFFFFFFFFKNKKNAGYSHWVYSYSTIRPKWSSLVRWWIKTAYNLDTFTRP